MTFLSKFSNRNKDGEESSDPWREKYLNLLDQQEQLEQTYKEDHNLLCSVIVRLAIVASGFDPQLEPNLQRIRRSIKAGLNNAELKVELDAISEALTNYKAVSLIESTTPVVTPLRVSTQQADSSLLFAFLQQRYPLERQKQALLDLQNSPNAWYDEQELFSTINKLLANEPISTAVSPADVSAIAAESSSKKITHYFLDFFDRIEIPEALSDHAALLKVQLKTDETDSINDSLLEDIVAFLLELGSENKPKQQEIDLFLAQITDQLAELGKAVTGSSHAALRISLNRNKLDDSVSEQMNELQRRSLNATQLEPLKHIISSQIKQITQEIQLHRQQEVIEREEAQQALTELCQRLNDMEYEASDLKNRLQTASKQASIDPLTGLPNRYAYNERVKTDMASWLRYHTPLCLLIWDIDHFKTINDQYGHQVGDTVLSFIANVLVANCRETDFVARFGGEEFTMLLPHTNKQSAFKLAHKLRCRIEQSQIKLEDRAISVTISGGITQFLKGDLHETAFARADAALYRAKTLGRNQCCIS